MAPPSQVTRHCFLSGLVSRGQGGVTACNWGAMSNHCTSRWYAFHCYRISAAASHVAVAAAAASEGGGTVAVAAASLLVVEQYVRAR